MLRAEVTMLLQSLCYILLAAVSCVSCCPQTITNRGTDGRVSAIRPAISVEVALRNAVRADAEKAVKDNENISVMDQEFMAYALNFAWSASKEGYTAGYADPADDNIFYVFPEMRWTQGAAPGVGTISVSMGLVVPEQLKNMRIITLRPPLRYRAVGPDQYEAGYFEPSSRVFFRWRGVKKQNVDIYFSPRAEAISPVLARERIDVIVDIDPPEDAR